MHNSLYVAYHFMSTCIVTMYTALDAHVAQEFIDFQYYFIKPHSQMLLLTPCHQHSSLSKDFTFCRRKLIRVVATHCPVCYLLPHAIQLLFVVTCCTVYCLLSHAVQLLLMLHTVQFASVAALCTV